MSLFGVQRDEDVTDVRSVRRHSLSDTLLNQIPSSSTYRAPRLMATRRLSAASGFVGAEYYLPHCSRYLRHCRCASESALRRWAAQRCARCHEIVVLNASTVYSSCTYVAAPAVLFLLHVHTVNRQYKSTRTHFWRYIDSVCTVHAEAAHDGGFSRGGAFTALIEKAFQLRLSRFFHELICIRRPTIQMLPLRSLNL